MKKRGIIKRELQTVPEWYEFPVSATQAYKMLGNGWTVDVIAHLLKYMV
ncbi:MAG: DNA cytosine methyltransferase [Lachnospiraceae bacterium]|nr:DNA cytosine methyltransferase [Lachnospiraceae bacterium]